jgi:hypothetical protein
MRSSPRPTSVGRRSLLQTANHGLSRSFVCSLQEFAKLIKDLGAPKLGLSSVGGDVGSSVANAVG